MRHRWLLAITALSLLLVAAPAWRASAQTQSCFPETGQCVSGPFLTFWQNNGGLPVFGFPLSTTSQENGRTVQYFERQRFELHPENQAPYNVLLGRLGAELLARSGVDWTTQPTSPGPVAGCLFFAQTQHNVCNQQGGVGFLATWSGAGLEFDGQAGTSYGESLALFGLPITEPYQMTAADGTSLQVQWFERARFEWHPNNPNPYKVLLGRLGAEVVAPTTPPVTDTNTAAAVQTLLDYYGALNRRSYDEAYALWQGGGAASGQTLQQFRDGYAQTVQIDLRLGQPTGAQGGVTVPATIVSVVNDASASIGQRVRVFTGSYTLRPEGGAWRISAAAIVESGGVALPFDDQSSPEKVLQSYYAAINGRSYASAYTYWSGLGSASQQPFGQFAQGFAQTASVEVALGAAQIGGAAGSLYADLPVAIVAAQTNAPPQLFCGTYTLRRLNVPPFDQLGWRIERAAIAQRVPGQQTASASQLLTLCQQQ